MVFRIVFLRVARDRGRAAGQRGMLHVAIESPHWYGCVHHEAASKFLGQSESSADSCAKYSATAAMFRIDGGEAIRFNEDGLP
jgi:hypothetical protein